MEQNNITFSLTPPSELNLWTRLGSFMVAIGLLAVLIALLQSKSESIIPIVIGGVLLAGGSFLLLTNSQNQKSAWFVLSAGLVITMLFVFKITLSPMAILMLILGFTSTGAILFFHGKFGPGPAGIRNNGIFLNSLTAKGVSGWILAVILTGFYVVLYWFPELLHGLITGVDPLNRLISGASAVSFGADGSVIAYNQWFVYGLFYTMAIMIMGVRMLYKYRHNRYQIIRTFSVMFFQLILAFLLPLFMASLNHPEHYFSYFWPLDYDAIFPATLQQLSNHGNLGKFILVWTVVVSFIAVPVLTYFFGKRWYCSWVCGCGGLAETAGDSFRQNSDKSLKAWRIERIMVHGVLLWITLLTAALLINWKWTFMEGNMAYNMQRTYGFFIGAVFSGVVGVGFYPIMGSRVWCRFGCPQAAILGILQKYFSRFRITTNGGQCISCGNCSTYCEMGIDVKWYAQRGQNIVRASCVGCGICSAVCPRGVLNLENGPLQGRKNEPVMVTGEGMVPID
jgi:ferredoxin-type protein NapH